MDPDSYRYGRRVTIIGIVVNAFIAAVKLSLGILGKSAVLVAEAFDSIADIGATTGILIGYSYAYHPKDEKHPHGHGKIESISAFFVGLFLAVTGVYIIYENASRIYHREYARPEWIALLGVAIAIVSKTGLYFYTIKASRRLNSPAISASAADHIADVYRLSGVFVGISFAILNYPIIDPIAALLVAGLIIKTAFTILKDATNDLIDAQMPAAIHSKLENAIAQWNPECHLIEAVGRRMGPRYQVTAKVRVSPYSRAVDNIDKLSQLESLILMTIREIQGVDIIIDVDKQKADSFEERFKKHVYEVLEHYKDQYIRLEDMEFHFMEGQHEAHFDMIVSPEMPVETAHEITTRIEQAVYTEFPDAQIIIHIEPTNKK